MIRQVINWFTGGFFRKLGSIFAYVVLGLIISLILTKFNINIFGVIKADTVNYTKTQMDIQQCEQSCNVQGTNCVLNNCIWDSDNSPQTTVQFGSNNGHMKKVQFITRNNSGVWNSGTYKLTMYYYTTPFSMSDYTGGKYNLRFYVSPNYNTSSYIEGISNYISFYDCSLTQRGGSGNGFDLTCNFGVTQPIKNVMIEFDFKNELNPNQTGLVNSESAWYGGVSSFTFSTDSTAAINSQTTVIQNNFNETNQNINELKDTLSDDDVSSDVSDGIDFFDDFDIGSLSGLTQIIISPFQFLGQLVVGNTSDMCFTLKGKQACLPNGQKMIWNKNLGNCDDSFNFCPSSNGIELFKTFFNLVVGGFLSYKLLLKIFRSVHKALDPTENHIEVLKL